MRRFLPTIFVLMLCASVALAQTAGTGLKREQGVRNDRPAGQQAQPLPVGILRNPAVQQELKLTDDQNAQISRVLNSIQGDSGEALRQAQFRATDQVRRILNPEQRVRFVQIALQVIGPTALAQPNIARDLNITREQNQQFREIIVAMNQAIQKATQPSDSVDRQKVREEVQSIRADAGKKILALLTEEQSRKWQTMLGPKFEF